MAHSTVTIEVNNQPIEVASGTTVQRVLGDLQLDKPYTAVAVNGEVVPRVKHDQRLLQTGDRITVLQPVGGG